MHCCHAWSIAYLNPCLVGCTLHLRAVLVHSGLIFGHPLDQCLVPNNADAAPQPQRQMPKKCEITMRETKRPTLDLPLQPTEGVNQTW